MEIKRLQNAAAEIANHHMRQIGSKLCPRKLQRIYKVSHATAHGSYFAAGAFAGHGLITYLYIVLFALFIIGLIFHFEGEA